MTFASILSLLVKTYGKRIQTFASALYTTSRTRPRRPRYARMATSRRRKIDVGNTYRVPPPVGRSLQAASPTSHGQQCNQDRGLLSSW